ncbi:MAG: LysR family transcriptional regulator [Lachnospiraceae bacterium]|nr:LysR family transcriptional regulator [Lachnospiraceae bacterium]
MMDFAKIECFLAAARNLNFTRTAEELFLSQSNVTMKINAMEKELGFRLFERNRRGIELTDAGACLYKRWSAAYEEMQMAVYEAREYSREKNLHSSWVFMDLLSGAACISTSLLTKKNTRK